MASVALPLIGMGLQTGLNFLAGRNLSGAYKRAGTTLADAANQEAATALTIPGQVNPLLDSAYGNAQTGVTAQAGTSGDVLEQQGYRAADAATAAGGEANAYLNPYVQAGGQSLANLTQLANASPMTFDPNAVTLDPSFAFRSQQGQDAIQRSAAARGGALGGGAAKALAAYNSNLASTEYGNAYQRALQTFQTNAAQRQQQLSNLSSIANLGYNAAGASGQNLMQTSEYGGSLAQDALKQSGAWRTAAAKQSADYGVAGATADVNNILEAQNVARQARLGGAQATAQSQLGAAGANAQAWGGLGAGLMDMATFGGGMFKGGSGGGYQPQYSGGPTGGLDPNVWSFPGLR